MYVCSMLSALCLDLLQVDLGLIPSEKKASEGSFIDEVARSPTSDIKMANSYKSLRITESKENKSINRLDFLWLNRSGGRGQLSPCPPRLLRLCLAYIFLYSLFFCLSCITSVWDLSYISNVCITPFAVHYVKICNHWRETAANSAKIHSLARKYEHLRINQIQLRFLHFNQHSITLLGIPMGHWAYKREKYTFINANIRVI